eukprot:CAMPEP_0178774154 /NCGR_PEP_ID=MMETSP0744-20121128/23497_1 /TAXON_ID=913974 /ORGANISM="Nitzschia punctata, Strain CCMP561" /LENGTH=56 /DNA_ID=CAMNT_0020431025 /DNA_START=99 /DNA_END=265 /DNA_ORIENTATION=+
MELARFPRRQYTAHVTPIELMPNLSRELNKNRNNNNDGDVKLWIKRDDMLGLTGGG